MFYVPEFLTGLFSSNSYLIHIMKGQPPERTIIFHYCLQLASLEMHGFCAFQGDIFCFSFEPGNYSIFFQRITTFYIKLASQFLLLTPKNPNCYKLGSSHNKGKFWRGTFSEVNCHLCLGTPLGFHKMNWVACIALALICHYTLL